MTLVENKPRMINEMMDLVFMDSPFSEIGVGEN